MATTLIITLLIAAGSLAAVVFAWRGRPSSPITLFGLAAASVLAAFLAVIAKAEGPVLLIAGTIVGLSGLALVATPAALLIWEKYQAHQSKAPDRPDTSGADEHKA